MPRPVDPPNPLRLPWTLSGDMIRDVSGIYLARPVSGDGGAWDRGAPAIVATMNAAFYYQAAVAALGRPPEWTDAHLRAVLAALHDSAAPSHDADGADVRSTLESVAREEGRL